MSDSGPAARVGSWFGPYRLVRLLRQGGMGEVYEAEDSRKRRMVALKLISQQFTGNPEFRARLQREADIAGRLTEPHVVPIHDYGEIDGRFFVEMRLVDGVDLGTLLHRDGPMAAPRAIAIIRQVGEVAAGDQDVARGDIAVRHPGGVRGIECGGDLADYGDRPRRGHRPVAVQQRAQINA
ncbi:protein kinase domain-containing protein, partial [Mycobacterium marseillense]|uniref:protein kinase domain-containing protein n=1 Tax=Mycobacterium marseillense TaxID=701042 RepID=UPI000B0BC048